MRVVAFVLLGASLCLSFAGVSVQAHSPYQTPFKNRYIPAENEALAAAYEKSRCNVCHVKGEMKKVLNPFGMAIEKSLPAGNRAELLKTDKMAALKDLEAAFTKVEMLKRPDGGTWGEFLKSGKLP